MSETDLPRLAIPGHYLPILVIFWYSRVKYHLQQILCQRSICLAGLDALWSPYLTSRPGSFPHYYRTASTDAMQSKQNAMLFAISRKIWTRPVVTTYAHITMILSSTAALIVNIISDIYKYITRKKKQLILSWFLRRSVFCWHSQWNSHI